MRDIAGEHLERVRTAVLKKHTAATIAAWLVGNTRYAGQPFSFEDHEYQERIISDPSRETNTQKCSQVGVSEAWARAALALVNVLNPYTVAYTLPTAKFAATFARTRIDPVIEGSSTMSANVHRTNNNSEVKQFGDSFLFLKGAAGSNAPISIPCDHLMHDEVDFSDQEVLGQYVSRLTHSKWKRVSRISTPTLPNFGINKYFRESRRFYNMVKCHHCNHHFVPDYYDDVKIPDFTGDLREITKASIHRTRWEEAEVICPKCGLAPSLQIEHREWVLENSDEKHVGAGFQVSPFDAPNIIKASYLIEASTKYDRVQDFVNFNLGLPMEDKEATMTAEDFESVFVHAVASASSQYVMGVDVGATYHFVVAAVSPYNDMLVVHTEQVHMSKARVRYNELRRQYRTGCTVMDSLPHGETVMALQEEDASMYASVYMKSKSVLTHAVVDREEDDEKGQAFVRQVNVNRSKALDAYMEFVREGHLEVVSSDNDDLITTQHMSMKRVKVYENESQEMAFSWQKSDGNDHFHHAFLYCYIASRIRGVGRSLVVLPIFTARKILLKSK